MRIERVSRSEAQKLLKAQKKPHKYHAKATVVEGIRFDSRKEAQRWSELLMLEKAGQISNLRRQVVFGLHVPVHAAVGTDGASGIVGAALVGTYIADFVYAEDGRVVVEDSKGVRTQAYRLKRKHLLIEYGITIKET